MKVSESDGINGGHFVIFYLKHFKYLPGKTIKGNNIPIPFALLLLSITRVSDSSMQLTIICSTFEF